MKNSKVIYICCLTILFLNFFGQAPAYVQNPNQTPHAYVNNYTQNIIGTYSSGTSTFYAENLLINNPTAVSSNAVFTAKAVQSIGILPGSSASGFVNGSFSAYIAPRPEQVVSYHPNGFSNIPLYDKFELGIKLPQDLTDKVNNFFGATNKVNHGGTITSYACANGCGNEFNAPGSTVINPYDTDKISLEATFNFPGKPAQTIYGFYYREYNYSQITTDPKYTTTDWIEADTLTFHWRVRFAPKYIGTYAVTWIVKDANGAVLCQDDVGQHFTTTTSASKGFVKLGTDHYPTSPVNFLVVQPDLTQPAKTILPIGVSHQSPLAALGHSNDSNDDMPDGDCGTYDCNAFNFSYPSRFWKHRETIRTGLAESGGNLIRVFSIPYSYNIEYEKAGVYDACPGRPLKTPGMTGLTPIQPCYGPDQALAPVSVQNYYKGINRQAIMWEFDRLLDMAKDNNLYVQWVTENGEGGFDVESTWPAKNPYSYIFSQPADLNHIDQFFTDGNAITAYKKRLRYIIARFGYSSNILDIELVNEIHMFSHTSVTLDNLFAPWLTKMTDFIKNPVSSSPPGLGHTDHLLTVSFEETTPSIQIPANSQIGNIQKLDFLSRHPYDDDNLNSFERAKLSVNAFKSTYHKPCQAGEMGISASNAVACSETMSPTFHTLLWSTTFLGGLTSSLNNYGGEGLVLNPLTNQNICNADKGFVKHFKPLQAFIKDINFDQDNCVPKYYKTNDQGIEAFYLIDNLGTNAHYALGYVRNRTFWWFNFMNSTNSTYYDSNLAGVYNGAYGPSSTAQPVTSGFSSAIQIQGLTPGMQYIVYWYDTYVDPAVSNPLINASSPFTASGTDYITPPTFGGSCHNQEFGFKISPAPIQKAANSDNSALLPGQKETQITDNDIKIYPNPSSDKIYVQYDQDKFKDVTITLYDLSGRLILKQNNIIELNTASLENGAYMVKFSTDSFVKTYKINVLH